MIRVQCFAVGELQANAYILSDIDNNALIIDPGDGADLLLEEIQRANLKLCALLATHGHFDHVMGAGEIQLSFPVALYVDKKDTFLLDRTAQTAKHFLGYSPLVIPYSTIEQFKDTTINIGPFSFQAMETPGHTPGGRAFYFRNEKLVFTGDTLFADGVGSVDHSYSDVTALANSVLKLQKLPKETLYYPGHGDGFHS